MIDVAFSPGEGRGANTVVVVDVLRATSTATQALAAGYVEVVCVESVEQAAPWRGPGRVLAGERNCVMPVGFDVGNSPAAVAEHGGEVLVLATTNGTPTIVAAKRRAQTVLLACVLNLEAVVRALRGSDGSGGDVEIVCSGTDGDVALEDTYLAGRLCAELSGRRSDAARVAEAVARGFETPLQALAASRDAEVLRASGLEHDIAYCARESTLRVVPRVASAGSGTALVVGGTLDDAGRLPSAPRRLPTTAV